MYTIPSEFNDFIAADCDRAAFIQNYLNRAGLEAPVLQMEGKNHIYVKFPQNQYNSMFRIKTVIAHYDRFPGSPGANDNSAAVFCLLEWAIKLARLAQPLFHNIRLIFTDGEELGAAGGVAEQGAFPLAQVFRRLGITNDDIFVFDCMGRGDVPILTQTILPPKIPASFVKEFSALEQRAATFLQTSANGRWFCLPCNYSDNASFIANGIPAVAITMLPSLEVNAATQGQQPQTWQLLHTPGDNLASLTPKSFEIFHNILNNLAALKTLC
ncbi:Peptidase family M28 [Treponema bryantii]|uniref:Peptidase family M28 n=1 Tax=Treponema bryantii TaxID=163 RepID=A0A1H8ZXR7_9SPIR|nr:M28 family peptidase [Treponema bryantii]SEP69229.1 Peptidase family M28 [Treponema bryantii]